MNAELLTIEMTCSERPVQ